LKPVRAMPGGQYSTDLGVGTEVVPEEKIAAEGSANEGGKVDEQHKGGFPAPPEVFDSGSDGEDGEQEEHTRHRKHHKIVDFGSFLRWVTRKKGIVTNSYRYLMDELKRRFEQRIRELGFAPCDYASFASHLQGPGTELEWQQLDVLLTVDISRFFRDGLLWQFLLSSVLPPLVRLAQEADEPFRVWVMGGANGEEVYSLAAAYTLGLQHIATDDSPLPRIEIVVSEADASCVQRAKRGRYEGAVDGCKRSTPKWWACVQDAQTFREVPDAWMSQIFEHSGSTFQVRKRFQKAIRWRCERWQACFEESWQESVGSRGFHLVMARHGPFLYPTVPQQRELLRVIGSCLLDEGCLVIGKFESLPKASRQDWEAVKRDYEGVKTKDLPPLVWGGEMSSAKGGRDKKEKTNRQVRERIGNPLGIVYRKSGGA